MNRKPLPVCLLESRIQALTQSLMIWDLPSAVRAIQIAPGGGQCLSLTAPWPRLLLALALPTGTTAQLHVVAVKRQGPLQLSSPLFHAPFMDFNVDGRFAVGDWLPEEIDPRSISTIEAQLFAHHFSVVLHERTLRPDGMATGAAINSYHHGRAWRELSRSDLPRFPGRYLVSRKQTLNGWLQSLDQLTELSDMTIGIDDERAARSSPAALRLVQTGR